MKVLWLNINKYSWRSVSILDDIFGGDFLNYEDINIKKLINEDIQSISYAGARAQRKLALEKYYDNPNYCKLCGKIILVKPNQPVHDVRIKQFCDSICAAKYNNGKRQNIKCGPTSILGKYDDDSFINLYNSCNSYSQLAIAVGYKGSNSKIINQLKNRIKVLGLKAYEEENKSVMFSITKGELISRSPKWQVWRSRIQDNARKIYKNSDKPKQCIVCGYNKTYEVAHIKAVSDYDNDTFISEINDINNLVALCPNHHWEYDHNLLDLTEYII